jgi:hypothetical protein
MNLAKVRENVCTICNGAITQSKPCLSQFNQRHSRDFKPFTRQRINLISFKKAFKGLRKGLKFEA